MRKTAKRWAALTMAALMAASMAAGCGGGAKSGGGDAGGKASDSGDVSADGGEAADSGEKKLIYVFIKNRGDLSYWDSMAEGGDRAKADFSDRADIQVVETTDDLQANLTAMYEAADKKADLIITASDFKDNLVEVANEFPEMATAIISEDIVGEADNIYGVDFSVSEAAFLGGIVAADLASQGLEGTTGSKTVGFIGGMDESVVIQEFLLGYFQGARYYDPEVKLLYNYVGGWNDPDTARTQALTQYNDAKADVVFACAGGSGNGVHKAAAEAGRYVIGVDSDQSLMYNEDKTIQDRFVTSVLKKVGNATYDIIGKYLDEGTLPFGEYEIHGLAEDAVGMVEDDRFNAYVSDAGKEAIEKAKQGIIDGSIKIEGAIGKEQADIKGLIDEYVSQ